MKYLFQNLGRIGSWKLEILKRYIDGEKQCFYSDTSIDFTNVLLIYWHRKNIILNFDLTN